MTERIYDLAKSAQQATKTFRTYEDGKPDLVPIGLEPVDNAIGGLFAGSAGILGAATGVGKSSTILSAAIAGSRVYPVGILSLEDTPDVLGSRAIAMLSGVDSLAIRTKRLSPIDISRIRRAEEKLAGLPVHIAYCIGKPLDVLQSAIRDLGALGCRMIWVDYIQKIKGGQGDRRNEISNAFSALQGSCADAGAAAMFVSQFSRQVEHGKEPSRWWLKESGDLENEARLIILMWRDENMVLHAKIDKSTFGGEGARFDMKRDSSGTLRLLQPETGELPF